MLRIRPEQVKAFADDDQRRTLARLSSFLSDRSIFSAESTPEDRYAAVTTGLNKAKTYGITTEMDVAIYLILTLDVGNRLDPAVSNDDWVREILSDADRSGRLKIMQLNREADRYLSENARATVSELMSQ